MSARAVEASAKGALDPETKTKRLCQRGHASAEHVRPPVSRTSDGA
jgi:hypothetical protein